MLVNPGKAMRSNKVMLKIKTQDMIYGCNICGISFMYEEGIFVSNIVCNGVLGPNNRFPMRTSCE